MQNNGNMYLTFIFQKALTCHPNYIIPVIPVFYVMHVSFKSTFFEKEAQSMYGVPAQRPAN